MASCIWEGSWTNRIPYNNNNTNTNTNNNNNTTTNNNTTNNKSNKGYQKTKPIVSFIVFVVS